MLAQDLQSVLQKLAKPWHRIRALNIYRDQTNLSATPKLWDSIAVALDNSEHLVLLLSPAAAASKWVPREIKYWLSHKSLDTIILVLTEGDLVWDDAANRFAANASTALPVELINVYSAEPLHIDMRGLKKLKNPSLDDPFFKGKVAPLAAKLHGLSVADLLSVEAVEHKRTIRWRNGAASTIFTLLVGAMVLAWLFYNESQLAGRERDNAMQQLTVATARLLASQAADAAKDGEHHLSLLLARASLERYGTLDADRALRDAMSRVPEPVGRVTHKVSRPDRIDTISFSPGGKFFAIASGATVTRGGHTTVWRTDTLEAVSIEIGAPGPAYFSPVEDALIVGSDDHVLRVIEVPSGTVRRTIRCKNPVVVVLAIEPQGRYAVTDNYAVGDQGEIEDHETLDIVDLTTGRVFATVTPSSTTGFNWGQAFFFERDGATFLASGWGRGPTDEWRITDKGLECRSVPGALSRNGKWVLVASESQPGFQVVSSTKPADVVIKGDTFVRYFQFSPHTDLLALTDHDGRLFLWDLAEKRLRFAGTLQTRADDIIFSPDGKLFASRGSSQVWNAYTGEVAAENFASEEEISAQSVNFRRVTEKQVGQISRTHPAHGLAFSPTTDRMYANDDVGNVFVWHSVATSHIKEKSHVNQCFAAVLDPSGDRVLVGSYKGVFAWDFETYAPAYKTARFVSALAYSRDGKQHAFSTDPALAVNETPGVHVASGKGETAFLPFESGASALAFDQEGKRLAIAADVRTLIVDLGTGERRVVREHAFGTTDLKFHPTRNWLAIASGDGSEIVDLATGTQIAATGWAYHITFSADGNLAALHDRDSVWVLQLNAKQVYVEVARLAFDLKPSSIDFDPTGRLLAIGTRLKGVGIWDWRQPLELARIPAQNPVLFVQFLPGDTGRIVVVEENGLTLNFWRREELLKQSASRALRGLSRTELKRYLGDAAAQ